MEEELLALPGVGPYAAAHIMMLMGRYSRMVLDSATRPKYARLSGRKTALRRADHQALQTLRPLRGTRVLVLRNERLARRQTPSRSPYARPDRLPFPAPDARSSRTTPSAAHRALRRDRCARRHRTLRPTVPRAPATPRLRPPAFAPPRRPRLRARCGETVRRSLRPSARFPASASAVGMVAFTAMPARCANRARPRPLRARNRGRARLAKRDTPQTLRARSPRQPRTLPQVRPHMRRRRPRHRRCRNAVGARRLRRRRAVRREARSRARRVPASTRSRSMRTCTSARASMAVTGSVAEPMRASSASRSRRVAASSRSLAVTS